MMATGAGAGGTVRAEHRPGRSRSFCARVKTNRHDPYKNALERDWAGVLEALRRDGQLVAWHYEAFKLHLGGGAWFCPDFMLVWKDGEVSVDECKGFMREAAHVRLRVAAALFPFRIRLVRRGKGRSWNIEEIKA